VSDDATQDQKQSSAMAVAALTGWADNGADPSMAAQVIQSYIEDGAQHGQYGGMIALTQLTIGLVNVAGQLLVWREAEQGNSIEGTLQELGQLYAG
jgi:hypothetical protein